MLEQETEKAAAGDYLIDACEFKGETAARIAFNGIDFKNTVFEKCRFTGCDFSKSSFLNTTFSFCDFSGCVFENTYWKNSRILNSKGDGADFIDSYLKDCRI